MTHHWRMLLVATAYLLLGVGLAADPAPAARAGRVAGIAGEGVTSLRIVNLDASRPATAKATFHKQPDGAATALELPVIGARGFAIAALPAIQELTNGSYSVTVESDRAVGVVGATMWSDAYVLDNQSEPSTDVLIPLAVKDRDGRNSILTVQNTSAVDPATFELALFDAAESVSPRRYRFDLPAGASRTLDLMRTPELAAVPRGFLGAARVTSARPMAVQALVDVSPSTSAVLGFEGVPEERAADTVFAPMVHAAMPWASADAVASARDSTIAVMNPGGEPVVVAVTYRGRAGTCTGMTYRTSPVTIPARRSVLYVQGPEGDSLPTGRSPLPEGCAASAVLSVTYGRVAAVVLDEARDEAGDIVKAGAYGAMAAVDADTAVYSPIYRNRQTTDQLTTGIHVMNTGKAEAMVAITFRVGAAEVSGCAACAATVPPGGTHLWWPPAIPELPFGTSGSAEIQSNQPVVLVVTDEPLDGRLDEAIASGIPMGRGRGEGVAAVPLGLRNDAIVPPTPTSTPSPTGGPTPQADTAQSALLVQNLDRQADVEWSTDLVNEADGGRVSIAGATLGPGGRGAIRLWENAELPDGNYSAVVSAAHGVGALARVRWPVSGRAVACEAPATAVEVLVPAVAKGYNGQTSLVAVQNATSSAAATLQVELYVPGREQPLVTGSIDLAAGASRWLDVGSDPLFAAMPAGTLGHMRLVAASPIAAQSVVRNVGTPRLSASFAGVPADRLAEKLYAPLFRRDYRGGTTSFVVANPGSAPVEVATTYYGSSGDCVDRRYSGRAVTVSPGSSATITQGASTNHNIPANCAGSAVLSATGGRVMAIVGDTITKPAWGAGSWAVYNALVADEGSRSVVVPFYRKSAAAGGATTGIQAMNVGTSSATVRVAFYDATGGAIQGCGTLCEATVKPSESHFWWPGDIEALPAGVEGFAWITSDQPVAVVALDQPTGPSTAVVDDGTAYVGVAAGEPGAPPPARRLVPYLPNPFGAAPTATPTPSRVPTQEPTATPDYGAWPIYLPSLSRAE